MSYQQIVIPKVHGAALEAAVWGHRRAETKQMGAFFGGGSEGNKTFVRIGNIRGGEGNKNCKEAKDLQDNTIHECLIK